MSVTENTQFWYSHNGDTLTQVTIRHPDGTTTETLTVNPNHACMGEWAQTQHEQNKEAAKRTRRWEVEQAEAKYQAQRHNAKWLEQGIGTKNAKRYAKQLKEHARQERHAEEKAARLREEEAYQESRRERDAQKKAAKALKEIRKKQEKIRKEQEKIRKEQEKMFGSW